MSALRPSRPDALLDLLAPVSYSRVGYALRAHTRARESPLPRMDGKVAILTGATSGIGEAAAVGLARLGASVWIAVRERERGERARERILAQARGGPADGEPAGGEARAGEVGEVRVGECDLAELSSVRRFASSFAQGPGRVHALVHNAGVLTRERTLSRDGIELTLATNVVGPFLLTQLLAGVLSESAPARVVNVSSAGMYTQRLSAADLQSERGSFSGAAAYARTKRMQVALSEMWAERLARGGVSVNAMHPGWVDTPGLRTSLPRFRRLTGPALRTPAQGADTIVWLLSSPEGAQATGGFFFDRARRPTHLLPGTRESAGERDLMWAQVELLAQRGA